MKWNKKLPNVLVLEATERKRESPEIWLPIPIKAIDFLCQKLSMEDMMLYGYRIIYNFSLKHVTDDHYTPFGAFMFWHTDEIRAIGGKKRKLCTDILDQLCDQFNHSEGNFPKSYRYKSEILEGGYVLTNSMIPLSKSISSLRPIKDIEEEYIQSNNFLKSLDFREVNLFNPLLLADFWTSTKATIDYSIECNEYKKGMAVLRFNLKDKQNFKMERLMLNKEGFDDYKSLEQELLFQRKKHSLNRMSRRVYLTRDDTTFRLHNNLTGIPNECISHLSLYGERLREIDMNNCHYTLFANILCGYREEQYSPLLKKSTTYIELMDSLGGESIWDIIHNSTKMTDNHHPSLSLIKLAPFYTRKYGKYADALLFIHAAFKGQLYKVVGKKLFGSSYKPQDRERVKSILMSIFYSGYNDPIPNKAIFQKHFPTVYNIVNDLKAYMHRAFKDGSIRQSDMFCGCIASYENKDKTEYQAGNSCLSILLMNLEAHLFVDLILAELHQRSISAITKHDSVVVKESDYAMVKEITQHLLNQEIGEGRYTLKASK